MVTYVNIAIFLEILIIFKDGSIETKIFRQLYSQYFEFLESFRIGLIHQKYRTCFLLQKLEFNGINIAECLTDKRRRSSFPGGTMVRDLHHGKFLTSSKQDSNFAEPEFRLYCAKLITTAPYLISRQFSSLL